MDHFVRRMKESMQRVFELVRKNLGSAINLQKRQYNKKSWPGLSKLFKDKPKKSQQVPNIPEEAIDY